MNHYTLIISRRVYDTLRKESERAFLSGDIETGGIIIGYTVGELIHAVFASSDSRHDRSDRFSYVQDARGQQRVLDEVGAADPGIYYLGNWHKHPRGYQQLSPVDLHELSQIATNDDYKLPNGVLAPLAFFDDRGRFRLRMFFMEKGDGGLHELDFRVVNDDLGKPWAETLDGKLQLRRLDRLFAARDIAHAFINTPDGCFVEFLVNENNFLLRLDGNPELFRLVPDAPENRPALLTVDPEARFEAAGLAVPEPVLQAMPALLDHLGRIAFTAEAEPIADDGQGQAIGGVEGIEDNGRVAEAPDARIESMREKRRVALVPAEDPKNILGGGHVRSCV